MPTNQILIDDLKIIEVLMKRHNLLVCYNPKTKAMGLAQKVHGSQQVVMLKENTLPLQSFDNADIQSVIYKLENG